jgi:hypothetical protein
LEARESIPIFSRYSQPKAAYRLSSAARSVQDRTNPKSPGWVVIDLKNSKSPDLSYDVKVVELYAEAFGGTPQPEGDVVCHYAVNLKSIADTVSTKMDLSSRQRKEKRETRFNKRRR